MPGGMNLVLTPRNPSINNLVWINQTLLYGFQKMKPEIVMDFFIFPNSNPECCIDDVFLDELITMVQIKMRSLKRNGRKYECRESDCVRGRYAASFSANWDVVKLVCRIGGRLV